MPKGPKDWTPNAEKHLRKFFGGLSSDEMWTVMEQATRLHTSDSPSGSDVARIALIYADGPELVREGIDAAFRWWTGYNFDSVVAQALHGPRWESVVAKWRPGP